MNLAGGLTALFIGPPGTAKSTLLGSCVEVEGINKALLLAPTPREIESWKYAKYRDQIPFEVFQDLRWHPPIGKFEAGAFTQLYERITALYSDEEYDAVLLDTYDGAVRLASHEILAPERAATPKETRDSRSYYGSLKHKLENFTEALTILASPLVKRPKHVFVAIHAQPTKEDDKQKTTDSIAKGIEFLGEVQPMVEGGHRHGISGDFTLVGFTGVEYENVREGNRITRQARYVVQLDADPERHAKTAIIPRINRKVPALMPEIFRAIEEASKSDE